jgi:ESF2/ABP1 family protein
MSINEWIGKLAYERAARQQRMQTELEQARRENKLYLQNVERGQLLDTIRTRKQERIAKTSASTSTESVSCIDPNMERVHRTFRQKSVVKSEVDSSKSKKKSRKQSSTVSSTKVDSQVASVLAKLF